MDDPGSSSSDDNFRLSGFLTPERAMVLESAGKTGLLRRMINLLATSPAISSETDLAAGIFHREQLMSTGIGQGIAIPHVRLASVSDLTVAAALIRGGVADYSTPDGVPVRLVIMIAARLDQHAGYLRLLSRLSSELKDEACRDRIFSAVDAADLFRRLTLQKQSKQRSFSANQIWRMTSE